MRRQGSLVSMGANALVVVLAAAGSCGAVERLGDEVLAIDERPYDDVGWNLEYAASVPSDALRIVTAPARWEASEWALAGIAAGSVALAYQVDERVARWAQDRRSGATDEVARIAKPFGREVVAVAMVGFAVASPFVEDRRVTRTALLGLESLLVAGAGYAGLQLVTHRQRPSTGADHDDFGGLHGSGSSFPSGHATAAFAFAGVLAHEWSDIPGAAPAAYGIAALVGLSRINDNAHWASDVVAGAILGWASAAAVEYLHPRPAHVRVAPFSDGRSSGLTVGWRF
jgi:membrane-associated phospholipid phosphatase